jgi:SAM-dependent methyltransferase
MKHSLKDVYNAAYQDEDMLSPLLINEHAVTTGRYDDVARLLLGCGGSFLEVGGGTGRLGLALEKRFDRITVTDIADHYLRMGERDIKLNHAAVAGKFEFSIADLDDRIPYPNGSFDAVAAIAVIEHVVDPFHALDEIARVTKPGGVLIVTVPNIAYLKHIVNLLLGRLPLTGTDSREMQSMRERGWDGHHFHYFTRSSLSDLLKHCGFDPEVWTSDGKWAKYRRWWLALCGSLTVRARRVGAR